MLRHDWRCQQNNVGGKLPPIDEASVLLVKIPKDRLVVIHVHVMPDIWETTSDSSEGLGAVLSGVEDLVESLNFEELVSVIQLLVLFKFLNHASDLRHSESIRENLLLGWKFGRWRVDVVEDSFIHGEVHELDPELSLDLSLLLDGILDDHAHLLNGIHLYFL